MSDILLQYKVSNVRKLFKEKITLQRAAMWYDNHNKLTSTCQWQL